jgi:hypothetical protein
LNGLPPLPELPRWFWLLPLLAIAAWWPIEPYWQSDDFLALHYAQDLRHALADFAGPQYAATDIWLFYRPFITLSFWFDQQIGGSDPFVSHLSNVLAHGCSALLAGLLWRRFLPTGQAFAAGLLWALLPSHTGSLAWAVGRVDSHTTVWCLLALLLCVRQVERRREGLAAARSPMLLATAAALCSKELAFVVPPLASLLAFLLANPEPLRARINFAARTTLPLWLLFAAYFALRYVALGRFGGYLGATYEAWPMAEGLATITANLLVPMRWIGSELATAQFGGSWLVWTWIAAIPVLVAAALWLRRPRALAAAVILFLVASAPMAAFFSDPGNVHSLRYFYLPSIVLAGLVAGGGRIVAGLAILAWFAPFVAMRQTQLVADRESASMHRALLREAADGAPSPMFAAGLPHSNRTGSVVQLHFGVDRMLEPPFCPGGTRLYALRPLAEVPGVVRLSPTGDVPFTLPKGSTWFFADATALGRAPESSPRLPDLEILGDADGVLDVSSAKLLDFALRSKQLFQERTPTFGLRTPGVKPMGYRVTIFTANGYLSCLCLDYGLAGTTDGWIDMLRFLARDEVLGIQPAVTAVVGTAWAGEALKVPTAIDLDPAFPTLVEAGSLDPARGTFVPTHRARRLITLRFDRGYPGWVRAVQGKG